MIRRRTRTFFNPEGYETELRAIAEERLSHASYNKARKENSCSRNYFWDSFSLVRPHWTIRLPAVFDGYEGSSGYPASTGTNSPKNGLHDRRGTEPHCLSRCWRCSRCQGIYCHENFFWSLRRFRPMPCSASPNRQRLLCQVEHLALSAYPIAKRNRCLHLLFQVHILFAD